MPRPSPPAIFITSAESDLQTLEEEVVPPSLDGTEGSELFEKPRPPIKVREMPPDEGPFLLRENME